MLNPGEYFKNIIIQARSVILLGGTLQPFPYLRDMLFPFIPLHELHLFSCGHIVDPSHVYPTLITKGLNSNIRMEFTFEKSHNRIKNNGLGSGVGFTEIVYTVSLLGYGKN